jgi:hypothetical protein|tara:strand:- start:402 stop:539 length:138 start_codon:yes stop_codon:yes gene_type:complete
MLGMVIQVNLEGAEMVVVEEEGPTWVQITLLMVFMLIQPSSQVVH